MNYWPTFDTFVQGIFGSFHENQTICYPTEINYQLISPSFYSFMDCDPLISTEINEELEKGSFVGSNHWSATKIEKKDEKNKMNLKQKKKRIKKVQGNKNIKTKVFKVFMKALKKDTTCALIIKQALGIEYPMSLFFEELNSKLPENGKYIRLELIHSLCHNQNDVEFSKIFRTLLRNFLMKDYKLLILQKNNNCKELLRASRDILRKIFDSKR